MENYKEAEKTIEGSQNIWIFPSENLPDSIPASLALFYTLKKLSKNVNLFLESFPKNIEFLVPSLDNINYPGEFIISIKNSNEDISQLYYEKNENGLKLFFKIKKGIIKKENISFDWTWGKPDLIITIGFKKINEINPPHHFLYLNSEGSGGQKIPILNIDAQNKNQKFGKINLIDQDSTITEITTQLIKSIDENLFEENISTCLLTGFILISENFSKPKNLPQIFERVVFLIKKQGSWQKVKRFVGEGRWQAEPEQ